MLAGDIKFTHRGERHLYPARGCAGGKDGAKARSVIIRADGSKEIINSKLVTELWSNDRVVIETAGGGGYGLPKERDREQLIRDLRNGKVSEENARETYGMA